MFEKAKGFEPNKPGVTPGVKDNPSMILLDRCQVMKDNPPDLVLSGINRGGNLGEDVTYSGTVAAAMIHTAHAHVGHGQQRRITQRRNGGARTWRRRQRRDAHAGAVHRFCH